MANSSMVTEAEGVCKVNLKIENFTYQNVELLVMKDLCSDVLIGHDILNRHSSVEIGFDGNRPPLTICSLAVAQVPPVSLFSNLNPDCRPLVTKSRRQTVEDNIFMALEVQKLLQEGVIEPSNSPWRAQAFVIRGENHKPRMVVDYFQTINKYTLLDAYPLPKIEEVILKISKNKVFSKIDLQRAYHQIPIQDSERHYTAFKACGKLYQFLRVPFGVTNGVACFQRVINKIIEDEGLTLTYPFIDDVTVYGKDQKGHDDNLEKFMTVAKKYSLTLNEDKCTYSSNSVHLLGYIIQDGIIKPDPERLKPLRDMPVPKDSSALQRALEIDAVLTFNSLKDDVVNAALATIEDDIPFRVETDSSDFAIGATLRQAGRPVAFFSRSLHASELRHSSPEKEAYAIVESLLHWRHFLMGKHFEVFTDQQAVTFVFNQRHGSKIKNEKLIRWRLEFASFKFDIIYRPGKQNVIGDTLSRITGAITP
ncbi:retrovirus-related Pol polyprotein from transposon opus [Trichonephila clavipes]|nr:retrovirus-related Pol polyprotein from transposon opus [Trichonephila clavipes]